MTKFIKLSVCQYFTGCDKLTGMYSYYRNKRVEMALI